MVLWERLKTAKNVQTPLFLRILYFIRSQRLDQIRDFQLFVLVIQSKKYTDIMTLYTHTHVQIHSEFL